LRVLYDHQLFSLQNAGGALRYHYELARYLGKTPDVSVKLLLGFSNPVFPYQELSSDHVSVMQMKGINAPGLLRYAANELLGNGIEMISRKVDIYHPTLYRAMPLVRSRKIVVTHHDCIHERFPDLFRNAARVIRAKRNLYAAAHAVICGSESSRRDLLQFYNVDESKLCIIQFGLSKLVRDSAAAEHFRNNGSRPYVLYVGSRAPYKNFNALLRGFARCDLQDAFDLVAMGGGALLPSELATARDLKIDRSLQVYSVVSDALLAEAYASAELLVYPSLWEGFGVPPLEAMSLGCPVLVSNRSAMPEICRDGASYFDPNDPDSLAKSLPEALTLRASNAPVIARGREIAAGYDWQKCVDLTLGLYRTCLGN
jgi:glycosyltransferase involved in cell wall biosynthesis